MQLIILCLEMAYHSYGTVQNLDTLDSGLDRTVD